MVTHAVVLRYVKTTVNMGPRLDDLHHGGQLQGVSVLREVHPDGHADARDGRLDVGVEDASTSCVAGPQGFDNIGVRHATTARLQESFIATHICTHEHATSWMIAGE